MPGPDDQTCKPEPNASTEPANQSTAPASASAAPAEQDLSKAPWAQPEFLFPNASKGDFSSSHPPGYTPPPSPAFGHFADPPSTTPAVPGVTPSLAPPSGPLAPTVTPMPGGALPAAPASKPLPGVINGFKNFFTGKTSTGTDFTVGGAPTLGTSKDRDNPQNIERAQRKADDTEAEKSNVTGPPNP